MGLVVISYIYIVISYIEKVHSYSSAHREGDVSMSH